MPFSRLFRSRWAALFWSVGIVWTAIEVAAGTPTKTAHDPTATPTDATGVAINAADLAALAAAGG